MKFFSLKNIFVKCAIVFSSKVFRYSSYIFLAGITLFALAYFLTDFFQKSVGYNSIELVIKKNIESESIPDRVCNIADYGAISDGLTLNTDAINNAISDCHKKGGGTVEVPNGKFLTGVVNLKDNIILNLSPETEIVFSSDPNDYTPEIFTRFEGIEVYNYSSLIYARDCKNISITGSGVLNGQGADWQSWKKEEKDVFKKLYKMSQSGIPVEKRVFGSRITGLRPSFIEFINCSNVRIEGVKIINTPRWTIHPIYSNNVQINGVTVDSQGYNSDGVVIDSSKNVLIENSYFATGDDTIAIKSGLDQEGRIVSRPSENIIIRNSEIGDGHSAITIGGEMSGGVKNVFIQDIKITSADQGIRSKSLKGRGGYVRNISIDRVEMKNIANSAIMLDLTYPASTVKTDGEELPIFDGFDFNNIRVDRATQAVEIEGLKNNLIKNIRISDFYIGESEKGIILNYAKNIDLSNISFGRISDPEPFQAKNCENVDW